MHELRESEPEPAAAPEAPRQLTLLDERAMLIEDLRQELAAHLAAIGVAACERVSGDSFSKERIRKAHEVHRQDASSKDTQVLTLHGRRLLEHFAEGSEIEVSGINPEIILVEADTEEAILFRIATLLWSVPVSRGYGRRMRFLLRDRSNGKLIGLFALGSPVFNLRDRDQWIGWSSKDRERRLINVMDAFVLGAVPPYSQLIGGKLVASMIGSREVSEHFDARYGSRQGLISGEVQSARLVVATTTSALGRSSLYNRLRLPGLIEFHRLGMSEGWGHFHVPDVLFRKMRRLLEVEHHRYFAGYNYGQGPNWRFRVVRQSLEILGYPEEMLRHGVKREIYGIPLAENWREFLLGRDEQALLNRPSARELAQAVIARWMQPRAERMPGYREWTREDTWALLARDLEGALPLGAT